MGYPGIWQRMSNVVNLRKGQRVELAKGVNKLRVELTWQASRKAETWDLDIMALELNAEQLIANNDICHLVFYNNLKDPQGALVHSGDDRTGEGDGEEMRLDVSRLHPEVSEVLFILNIFESRRRIRTSERSRKPSYVFTTMTIQFQPLYITSKTRKAIRLQLFLR